VATEKAGLDDLFLRGGIRQSPVELVGGLVYWMLMMVFFMAAVNALGLQAASSFLNNMLLYFPRIFAAIFILVLGLLLANFISGLVKVGAVNFRWVKADLLGRVVRYVIIVITSAMALEELDIAPQIVTAAFIILFGSVCFALSLAFGLGCKDLVGKFISEQLEKGQKAKAEMEGKP
jgi:small-conductance mechanosensitive channel